MGGSFDVKRAENDSPGAKWEGKRIGVLHRAVLLACLAFVGCSRAGKDSVAILQLDRAKTVSLAIFAPSGRLQAQPLEAQLLGPGVHEFDLSRQGLPSGEWTWKAVATDEIHLRPIAIVAGGVRNPEAAAAEVAGGEAGPPCSVATSGERVFLGWRGASQGHEVVACDSAGHAQWGYHRGPGKTGVRALAADDRVLYVLADEDGGFVYKLDAKTGERRPWTGKAEAELAISSLWGADAKTRPAQADYIAASNGRLYLTFEKDQFAAVLDGYTGNYVTTLTGPEPGAMAFSITPMRDPQTGAPKVIDFGVAAIAGNGLAYVLMEHDPAWVMMSTTRWLQPDERVVALGLFGDTMKSDKLTILTALGHPHHQVQLRPADAVEGFATSIGAPGGRTVGESWHPEALRDVSSIAMDSNGQIWVVESGEQFGRITKWKPVGKSGELIEEIFGPIDGAGLTVDAANPLEVNLGGMNWLVDPDSGAVRCLGESSERKTAAVTGELNISGVRIWSAPGAERDRWSVHRADDGKIYASRRGLGAELYRLQGAEAAEVLAQGSLRLTEDPK